LKIEGICIAVLNSIIPLKHNLTNT